MICVSVMYASGPDKHFDQVYYAQKHRPMVLTRLANHGLTRYDILQGVSGAAFVCIGNLYFGAVSDFEQGMTEHGDEIKGDIPNYTNIQPEFQISDVV